MDPIIDQLCWDLRKNGKFEDGFGEEQPEDATDKRFVRFSFFSLSLFIALYS